MACLDPLQPPLAARIQIPRIVAPATTRVPPLPGPARLPIWRVRLATLALPLAAGVTALAIYASSFALVEDRAIAAIIAALGLVSLAPLAIGGGPR